MEFSFDYVCEIALETFIKKKNLKSGSNACANPANNKLITR